MVPPHSILDLELFSVLKATGERAYEGVQAIANLPPSKMPLTYAAAYEQLGLLLRSCIDLILPDLLQGHSPRLTPRERGVLEELGLHAQHRCPEAIRRKLCRFTAAVARLPVHVDAYES
jgi:hypothetical protein